MYDHDANINIIKEHKNNINTPKNNIFILYDFDLFLFDRKIIICILCKFY